MNEAQVSTSDKALGGNREAGSCTTGRKCVRC